MKISVVRILSSVAAISFIALMSVMLWVGPSDLGPFGITAWFVGLGIFLTSSVTLMLHIYSRKRMPIWLHLRRASIISIMATAIIALNSLRQLTIGDIILLVVLGVVINFYMRRVY